MQPLSSKPIVSVEMKEGGYAIMTLQKEPVNSLDHQMWGALESALDELEANSSVRGLIIASGIRKDIFSAGNDLMELYAPRTSQQRYSEFWITSNRFLVKLYRSRLATIAAVRGACPAGGCIISMCCDYRVMTVQGSFGLNEVQLGIPVPKYWGLLMSKLAGTKAAERLLLTGKLVSPQEAKALGLIDDVVSKEALLSSAETVMQSLVKLPGAAFSLTKLSLRESFAEEWEKYYVLEPVGAWKMLTSPETIRVLDSVLQRLSKSSKL